jgi:hypothetical protein
MDRVAIKVERWFPCSAFFIGDDCAAPRTVHVAERDMRAIDGAPSIGEGRVAIKIFRCS